ncbi:MAG: Smr/MutS family protein [Paracoccaceae bacterium]
MMRRRTLRPEEVELWQAVARTARPLHPTRHPVPIPQVDAAPEPKHPAKPRLSQFALGQHALPQTRAPDLSPTLTDHPLRMDARTHSRMSKGKLAPEARVDLHGMTLAQAHPELIHFILNARAAGLRLVLVITGKGKMMHDPVPRPTGALRHQVPHWLRLPPLSQAVQQVTEAHLKHGGSGAYYVYLRRS